jgi:hypothetical protein
MGGSPGVCFAPAEQHVLLNSELVGATPTINAEATQQKRAIPLIA